VRGGKKKEENFQLSTEKKVGGEREKLRREGRKLKGRKDSLFLLGVRNLLGVIDKKARGREVFGGKST